MEKYNITNEMKQAKLLFFMLYEKNVLVGIYYYWSHGNKALKMLKWYSSE